MQERHLHGHDQGTRHDETDEETDETSEEPTKSWSASGGGARHVLQRSLLVVLFGRNEHLSGLGTVAGSHHPFFF